MLRICPLLEKVNKYLGGTGRYVSQSELNVVWMVVLQEMIIA
jgi:hypothetical protein